MATIDPKVARVLDRQKASDSDDEDALIAELEEGDDHAFSALREKRLEQLHSEMTRAKAMKETQHGTYVEIKDEKELMDITTSTKLCVVHFKKLDFARCGLMDEKLELLSEKHFDTRFISINVDNAPFLVVKLGIQVLPCVIAFIDGVSVDRIIGFEGIGYRPDSITAAELETRLVSSNVLVRAKMSRQGQESKIKKSTQREDDFDDDEWD
jgi:thioredoxin-like negative regulator of GroEL